MRGKRDRAWLEQLRERAETALEDVEYMLGYDVQMDEDGNPRLDENGFPVRVSRCAEATRAKLNLALIQMHPDNVKTADAGGIRFEITGDAVKLMMTAASEMERASYIDVRPEVVALPLPEADAK